jgi:hypothetical protein
LLQRHVAVVAVGSHELATPRFSRRCDRFSRTRDTSALGANLSLAARVLGIPVPERAMPIINALEPGITLDRKPHRSWVPSQVIDMPPEPPRASQFAGLDQRPQTAQMLKWMLESSRSRVVADEIEDATKDDLDELANQGILFFDGETYRITDITSFSTFMMPWRRVPGMMRAV